MTAAEFPRPFVRPTRRPTAEPRPTTTAPRPTTRPKAEHRHGAAGSGGIPSPSCPRVVRDRGRPHRPHRAPTASAATAPPRSPARGAAARRRPPAVVTRIHGCLRRHTRRHIHGATTDWRGTGPGVPASRVVPSAGVPGGSGASMLPARADRPEIQRESAPLQPVEQPGQFVRAPRGHQHPHPVRPCRATGEPGRQMPQRRVPRLRRCVQYVEAQPRRQVHGSAGHGRPSPVRSRTTAGPRDSRGSGGVSRSGGRVEGRGEGRWGPCQEQPPDSRVRVTLGGFASAQSVRKVGAAERVGGARMFARSGGNRCVRHGVSVRTGKTSLVGGATRKARASHVRHRRTDGEGICLACGNIVSHHQVGADVGVRGQEAKDGVGSWNERSPLAGLSCGRTGRGASPYCLTALRSD